MIKFTLHHHTAKIFGIARDNLGFYEVVATGVLTPAAIRNLSAQATPLLMDARALVIRLDAALIAMDLADWPERKRSPDWEPPVALVVAPDTYVSAIALCEKLAEEGLIRAVFLPSQAELAYRWAARHAGLAHRAMPE